LTIAENHAPMSLPLQAARPAPTLVIGLGNPILGDDGVGWRVVEDLESRIADRQSEIETDFASLGGLSLMERMLGYERVILVDSMDTGQVELGSLRVFPLEALQDSSAGHSASAHDTSLLTALLAARAMGAEVPARVEVVAIEAGRTYDFSEELSPPVAAAVPLATQAVLELLRKEQP
jgi:hydrogenase maturation protease